MKTEEIILGAAGLAGLYLLSRQDDGLIGGGGGLGGLAGDDENGLGDTIINFPDLDLSNIWGDAPSMPTKKEADQLSLDLWAAEQPWFEALQPGGDTIGDWFKAQPESTKIRSDVLRQQPMPYSITDPVKKQSFEHHGGLKLPDPVKLGLTPRQGGLKVPSYVGAAPSPYKPSIPATAPKKTYYAGPGKTWSI